MVALPLTYTAPACAYSEDVVSNFELLINRDVSLMNIDPPIYRDFEFSYSFKSTVKFLESVHATLPPLRPASLPVNVKLYNTASSELFA